MCMCEGWEEGKEGRRGGGKEERMREGEEEREEGKEGRRGGEDEGRRGGEGGVEECEAKGLPVSGRSV